MLKKNTKLQYQQNPNFSTKKSILFSTMRIIWPIEFMQMRQIDVISNAEDKCGVELIASVKNWRAPYSALPSAMKLVWWQWASCSLRLP